MGIYKYVKKINLLLFLLLPFAHMNAKQVSFQTFLSEFEKRESIDSTSFGQAFDFIDQAERYSKFLPLISEECGCKQENVNWQKGCYIEYKNFIIVTLQRYCSNFQDSNSQLLMENDGTDYVVIIYSSNGEILDYKIVGHSGAAYTTHVSTLKRGFGIVVEQRILDDVSLLRQYKNLVYTIYTDEYLFTSGGKIKVRNIKAPRKEIVDVMSSVKQFSFDLFLSYFQKWDKLYVDHTLFTPSNDQAELPFESCLLLIPDTLDHNCWPRDIQWIPCRYIENEKVLSFFLIKVCLTPKTGFIPYTDYLILEFNKNGTFKCSKNIYHSDDNSVVTNTKMQITEALKAFFTEN